MSNNDPAKPGVKISSPFSTPNPAKPESGAINWFEVLRAASHTANSSKSVNIGATPTTIRPIPQVTTEPDQILFHRITDGELTAMEKANSSGYSDAFWGLGGVSLGSCIPAVGALLNSYTGPIAERVPLSGIDLFQVILFAITLALSLAAAAIWCKGESDLKLLVREIRNRKKVS